MSANTPITVLAINPALDISYEVPQLLVDQKVRAATTHYHPGGNGINVARALARLEAPMHCVSLLGGASGEAVLQLLGERLGNSHTWFPVEGNTRVNATVLQQTPPGQFEVDGQGPEVPAELLAEVSDCFLEHCGDGIGVLTGSLPPGVPPETYRNLAQSISDQGGRAAIDAYGAALDHVVEAQPYLLRVNRYVLERHVKRRLDTEQAVAEVARELQQKGVDLVCVSLAGYGAILVDADNAWCCPLPKIRVHSTVAGGDALMAGLVAGAARGDAHPDMLHWGVVCGTATTAHPGSELFLREEVDKLYEQTEVRTLDV